MFLIKQRYSQFVEYFFYAVLFLLPWQTRYIIEQGYFSGQKWEYTTYSFYVIDGLILLLFVLSWFYKKNNQHDKAVETRHASSLLLIVSYIIIVFLSIYWAFEQELAFYYLVRFLGIVIFLYLLFKINLDFKKICWSLVLAGLMQAILGIVQFFTQKVWACKWLGMASHDPSVLGDQVIENAAGRWLRAYGALPHPNILAGFLVICLILAIYLYLHQNKKIIPGAISVILLIGLFFTFSRASFLALLVGLLFIFLVIHYFYQPVKKPYLNLLLCLLCVLTMLTGFYHSLITGRFSLDDRLEQKSITDRATYITDSLNIIEHYWPTGVGIGNYTEAAKTQPVHNIYLLIFCETGIFGLAVIILLLINSFIKIRLNNLVTVFIGTILLANIVIGFFDHYLWTLNFSSLLFWLPIGLLNINYE
jgi:hypothetical protein